MRATELFATFDLRLQTGTRPPHGDEIIDVVTRACNAKKGTVYVATKTAVFDGLP